MKIKFVCYRFCVTTNKRLTHLIGRKCAIVKLEIGDVDASVPELIRLVSWFADTNYVLHLMFFEFLKEWISR